MEENVADFSFQDMYSEFEGGVVFRDDREDRQA